MIFIVQFVAQFCQYIFHFYELWLFEMMPFSTRQHLISALFQRRTPWMFGATAKILRQQ